MPPGGSFLLRESRNPDDVRESATPAMSATAAQITTMGGIPIPTVVPSTAARRVREAGGTSVMFPLVNASTAPWTTAYIPSVMIRGFAANRWQMNPLSAPAAPQLTMIKGMTAYIAQWWSPVRTTVITPPAVMKPGIEKSIPPTSATSVCGNAAMPSNAASTAIAFSEEALP